MHVCLFAFASFVCFVAILNHSLALSLSLAIHPQQTLRESLFIYIYIWKTHPPETFSPCVLRIRVFANISACIRVSLNASRLYARSCISLYIKEDANHHQRQYKNERMHACARWRKRNFHLILISINYFLISNPISRGI